MLEARYCSHNKRYVTFSYVYVHYGMDQYTVQLGKASLWLNIANAKVSLALFLTVSLCEEVFEGKRWGNFDKYCYIHQITLLMKFSRPATCTSFQTYTFILDLSYST